MPLRQPPAEQPFSLIHPNWNPVSNGRVLLRLGSMRSVPPAWAGGTDLITIMAQ